MADKTRPFLQDQDTQFANRESLETLMRSVLSSVPDAMIVINQTGQILAFSAAAERLFGYRAADVAGKNVSVLMGGRDETHHDQYIRNYLKTGEKQIIGIGRIVKAKLANGDMIPVELKIGEADIDGQKLFTGYIRDISQQQANAHRLTELQAELENFSRLNAVGSMASAMAHELNQPLTAVANYLEAARDLLSTPDEETLTIIHEALNAAATQSIRAGQIVRRLRDYVSRGELDLRSSALSNIVEDAVSLAKVGLEGPLARVILRIPENLPPVLADQLQLRQVFVNLVRNAMEALSGSEDPQIWIHVTRKADDRAEVRVSDNGPGIAAEIDGSPFDAFYSSKPNGMGLGLSICQTIIDAHGSDITYSKAKLGGAEFTFSLHLAEEAKDNVT